MSEVLKIARVLATSDGLGTHMPDSSLRGWMGHANIMADYVRERVADAYKLASGKTVHASDCATSNAPAMEPGPCDCESVQQDLLEAVEKLSDAATLRALRGRDHVPSMRAEQEALQFARAAIARARGEQA